MPITKAGLKDHEIAKLVNDIRDALKIFISHQCLREIISDSAIKSLEKMQRRIDK